MKVVLLCGYYYPDTVGGTEAYIQMLGRDLEEMGHDVTVAAPATDEEMHQYRHDGLEVVRYPVNQTPSRAEVQGHEAPPYLDVWQDWLRRRQPDLVHMHSLTRGCSMNHARVVGAQDIPLFVTIHLPEVTCPRGTMMRWGTTPCDGEIRPVRCGACVLQEQGLPKPLAWGAGALSSTGIGKNLPGRLGTLLDRGGQIRRQKKQLQAWLSETTHVVVVSEWLKDVLVRNEIPNEQVTVSRHGLSDKMRSKQQAAAERRLPPDPSSPLTVGFVGRFTEVKGAHVLVKAICGLPSGVKVNAHLYGIAQTDADEEYLRRLKKEASEEPRVRFCGPMTEENRVDAFASFDVLAVPSVWFETGPFTVLEAFAAGIPVLGSNHGGIAERVRDGESGVLVAPDDPEAWRSALQHLYRRHESGNWNWQLSVPRSSQDVASEMIEIYVQA